MNGALFFADVKAERHLDSSAIRGRDITFVAGLEYDAIVEDDLSDLDLDRTSVLTAESESRLFLQMNRYYYRAAQLRDEAVNKLGQAPRRPLKAPGNRLASSEPVPFFHSLDGFLDSSAHADDSSIEEELSQGDQIRNQLVIIFHKLTVSIAKHFVSSRHSLEELVSEGDATLIRAVALFDPSRGFRFSTYATYAIRRRLARYVTASQHVRATPVDFSEAPPIVDRGRWTLPYEQAVEAGVEWLESALFELSPRERYIIRCRFGWGREFDMRTLQEIADELGVSRERVRQLEAKAIKKLQEIAAKTDLAAL